MPTFVIIVPSQAIETFDVEANSKEEAIAKFKSGDYKEHNHIECDIAYDTSIYKEEDIEVNTHEEYFGCSEDEEDEDSDDE